MSTTRTAAYSSLDKPWAYVVLTKPDVTFLVVITTVAGFYLASPGHLDWALLMHTLFGTTLVGERSVVNRRVTDRDPGCLGLPTALPLVVDPVCFRQCLATDEVVCRRLQRWGRP